VRLTAPEIRAAVYAVSMCRRSLAGKGVPPSVAALAARLDEVMRYGEVTRTRQPNRTDTEELEAMKKMELIGTQMVAEMLGCSLSTVLRRAADLDGRIVGRQFVFPARAVREYREAMEKNR
jgi:hypothetical protein